MSLKDDLLRKGYLPENLPPPFTSALIADYFLKNAPPHYLQNPKGPFRAATYNASKRGLTRRIFSAVHPVTAHDTAEFVATRWQKISAFFDKSQVSYSTPEHIESAGRALVVNSHIRLEEEKIRCLSSYRYIASTDIARFYHSIYTHSIPWAYHGKVTAKQNRDVDSKNVFFNKADELIRNGQDGQTVGIPVGPDMSRVFAEIVSTAIDLEFHERIKVKDYKVLRHVDDIWIGTNSHSDAEKALSQYREAIREFELDINEYKTGIFSENFSFSNYWPAEISRQIEFAIATSGNQAKVHLRSALEHSFSMAVQRKDDAILKYVLRHIDQKSLSDEHWDVIEPFLKRSAVHFGHTIDYVARILAWRHLARQDLDIHGWRPILGAILESHGGLGNDSEVCWTVYLHQLLRIEINEEIAIRIVQNCGPLALVALLNCVELKLVKSSIFKISLERLNTETDTGRYWPVFLEWKSKQWPGYQQVSLANAMIEDLSNNGVYIYDLDIHPVVFRNVAEGNFKKIKFAIESRSSIYDDEDEDDEEYDDEDDEEYDYGDEF